MPAKRTKPPATQQAETSLSALPDDVLTPTTRFTGSAPRTGGFSNHPRADPLCCVWFLDDKFQRSTTY